MLLPCGHLFARERQHVGPGASENHAGGVVGGPRSISASYSLWPLLVTTVTLRRVPIGVVPTMICLIYCQHFSPQKKKEVLAVCP